MHGNPSEAMPTSDCGEDNGTPQPEGDAYEAGCAQSGGTWLAQFRECEYTSREWCASAGGSFSECESACRHDPEAELCTEQCVQVCMFSGKETSKTEDGADDKSNLIMVQYPASGSSISSPLAITGMARGMWYFEASFPVQLKDADGNVIAMAVAQAQDDWMTEDLVPFSATLTFEAPKTNSGVLILKKDNPSGLPEHDDVLEIPIFFR